jgi:hypothetical protein
MPTPNDIETLLAGYPPEVKQVVLAARTMLDGAFPGAKETLDKSAKVIGYGYGPGYN